MNRKINFWRTVLTILITATVTAVTVLFFVNSYLDSLPIPVSNLIRVGEIIDENYMGSYDSKEVEEAMLGAVVGSLGDKYSVYFDEENAKAQMLEIDGFYVGIGIEAFANSETGKIEVISAYEDTPAHKAGIKSGDVIVSVDGKEYDASSFPEAVSFMRGFGVDKPMETEFSMVVERDGKLVELTLKREKIQSNKVKSKIIDDICYIRYPGFDSVSLKETKEIVNSLDESITGVVIDIRNNPGGEFNSAIGMSDLFLDEGIILYTVDKSGNREVYKATGGKCELPLAVIVNGASASAAEIFAGALQANDRAVIVGEKTYGKGVSQTVRYIKPGDVSAGAVKLTTCRNYTADDRWLNDAVVPDVSSETDMAEEIENDAAFKAAVESIKGK